MIRLWKSLAVCALALAGAASALSRATAPAPSSSEQFFIIESVNQKTNELVLKLPTEVTQLMRVSDKTTYRGEDGKPIAFSDLRAGDTVYISSERGSGGVPVARSIRKSPMTVEELHRHYLPSLQS